jgi:hypothetical protein
MRVGVARHDDAGEFQDRVDVGRPRHLVHQKRLLALEARAYPVALAEAQSGSPVSGCFERE